MSMPKLPKCEEERSEAMATFLKGAVNRGGELLGETERLRSRVTELEGALRGLAMTPPYCSMDYSRIERACQAARIVIPEK